MGKINKKNIINLILLILGCFLSAITFNILCAPQSYVTGGVTGIGVIFDYLFNIPVSKVLLIGNLLLLVVGIFVLGLKETAPSILGTIVYTLAIYITEGINSSLNINLNSVFLDVVVIGILFGVSSTMIYLAGYSSGGSDILALIFKEKLKIPMGKSLLIINAIILTLATFVFGIRMLVIALLIKFIESRLIDNFLIGISDSKVLFINTKCEEEVKEYIINKVKSGVSVVDVKSGYKNEKTSLLMCVVPTERYLKLKEEIIKIDKKAFITVLDSYEVYGGTNRYKLPLHDLRI